MEKLKLKSIYKFRKSCSSSHTEHSKISFAIFGFYNFIWILQGAAKTLKGVKILFYEETLESFGCSNLCPWFARNTLERAQTSQCGPRGLGVARFGEISATSPANSAGEWLGRL
jgi:hypothetical protein